MRLARLRRHGRSRDDAEHPRARGIAEPVGAQAAASGRRARDAGRATCGTPASPTTTSSTRGGVPAAWIEWRWDDCWHRPCDRIHRLRPWKLWQAGRTVREAAAARGRRNTGRTHGRLGLRLGEALPGRALVGARRAASSRAPALPRQAAPRRRRHRASRRGTGHYALLVRDRRPGTSRPLHGPRQPPAQPHSREPGRRAHRPRR